MCISKRLHRPWGYTCCYVPMAQLVYASYSALAIAQPASLMLSSA
jgi:hypothetical protein